MTTAHRSDGGLETGVSTAFVSPDLTRRGFVRSGVAVTATLSLYMRRALANAAGVDTEGESDGEGFVRIPGERPAAVRQVQGSGRQANAMAFSPDGARLAIGCDDGFVRIYDATSGAEAKAIPSGPRPTPVHALCFSPDGRRLAFAAPSGATSVVGKSSRLASWNADRVSLADGAGQILRTFSPGAHTGRIRSVAFSADGKQVAAIDQEYVVRAWGVDDGKEHALWDEHRTRGQAGMPTSTTSGFSSNLDRAIALNDADQGGKVPLGAVMLWDSGARTPRFIENRRGKLTAVAISPDGKRVLGANHNHQVIRWDFASGKVVRMLIPIIPPEVPPADRRPCMLAFTSDGRRFLSATDAGYVWIQDGGDKPQLLQTICGPRGFLGDVAFLPGLTRFASGGLMPLGDERIPGTRAQRFEPVVIWDVKSTS